MSYVAPVSAVLTIRCTAGAEVYPISAASRWVDLVGRLIVAPIWSRSPVQPVLDGVARQLHSVGDLEFSERRLHVVFHGAMAQREFFGDLLGGQALCDETQYLGLAIGEAGAGRLRLRARGDAPVFA